MKSLIRPLLFLAAVSGILLLSDLHNRKEAVHKKEKVRIALFRFNSNNILEVSERGVLNRIQSSDEFRKGNIEIRRY